MKGGACRWEVLHQQEDVTFTTNDWDTMIEVDPDDTFIDLVSSDEAVSSETEGYSDMDIDEDHYDLW